MRRILKNGILVFLYVYTNVLSAQKVRSITETYTHFETDSLVHLWAPFTHYWEYNKSGKIIKDHDKEGVCFVDYTYDKKGRIVKEESHCGEGYSICDISYKKGVRISNCSTNYNTEIRRDSSDANGRLIWKEHIFKYTEGDTGTLAGRSEFKYDDKGNRISEIQMDLKTKTPFLEYQMHYSNRLQKEYVLLIHYYVSKKAVVDSTHYSYDSLGRKVLIEEYNYDYSTVNRKIKLYRKAQFSYLKSLPSEEIRRFNDTLIESAISAYYFSFTDFHHSSMPTEIDHLNMKRYNDEFGGNQFHKYQIVYDSLGRVSSITGGEQYYSGSSIGIKREINYYKDDECVVKVFGKTYMDEMPVAQSYHYTAGRLMKIIEYSESGFPQYVRKYTYTYFK